MVEHTSSGHLDKLDGLNATRALILQGYYALRRTSPPRQIGTRQIAAWIKQHEPEEMMPSDALIQLTLKQAKVPHRLPGRPRKESVARPLATPFFALRRSSGQRFHAAARRGACRPRSRRRWPRPKRQRARRRAARGQHSQRQHLTRR